MPRHKNVDKPAAESPKKVCRFDRLAAAKKNRVTRFMRKGGLKPK